ncbi:helix-turn-helix transcriptional regulator [Paenibacillus medicaginis]|uniref:Helix-turn-helix transcriptional regulator n=1 Tax=Paenibacillus medicaginis TaxID=1470560 RepID=A0ABV5C524_9BACL
MNKTDRMLAILLELQRRSVVRAGDLADMFETSIRTIYRDIQALSEAGVPIAGAPGTGYSLMEGYFLPPVSFTMEEAVTLLIGTHFVEQKFEVSYVRSAQSSRAKIEAILPEDIRKDAARVQMSTKLVNPSNLSVNEFELKWIELLRQAVMEQKKVRFLYNKKVPYADGTRQSSRTASPYGLVLINGSWTLLAHCDLRQELRHFRLSRISELTVLEESFVRPEHFNLQEYRPPDDRNVHVRIFVQSRIADRVRETGSFYLEEFLEQRDGYIAHLRVRQPEEILQWVLGWGADVVVLEPESLRQRVREEAKRMLDIY